MESENAGNSRNEPILREERVRRSEVDRPTTSLRRTQRATVPMHLLEFFPEPQQQRIRPLGRQNDDVRSQKALVRRYCPEFAVVRATASHIVEGSKGAVSRKQIESEYNPVSASWLLDRESGAHNPSPVEEKPVRRRGDRSKHGHKDQGLGLLHRRQNRKGKGEASILSSSKCRLVKPLALRIKTPNAVPAPPSFFLGDFVSKSAIQVWPTIRREDSPPLRNSSSMSISPLPVEGTSEGEEKVYLDQRIEVANMLAVVEDDLSVTIETNPCSVTTRLPDFPIQTAVETARDGILHALAVFKGETTSTEFQTALFFLTEHYLRLGTDACRPDQTSTEGVWLTLTKPTFFYCLGENDSGDPMYTLGRMSFDLFSPSETICSLQGNFSRVERVDGRTAALMKSVPKSLYKEVQVGNTVLRTYE